MGSGAVAVVIPAYNRAELTEACLRSVRKYTEGAEVVLVDNGSTDDTPDLYRDFDTFAGSRTNRGFAWACNRGAAVSSGQTFVFLNNDTEVAYRWLEPLVQAAERFGIAGSKLVYPDGRIQHAGVRLFHEDGVLTAENIGRGEPDEGQYDKPKTVDAVTGACMAVRRDVFAACGGFDEGYWNGYEDVDFCLRVSREQGPTSRYVPESKVIHLESESGPERWSRVNENVRRLQDKWGDRWRSSALPT